MKDDDSSIPKQRMVAAISTSGQGTLIKTDIPAIKPGSVLVRFYCSMISAGTHLGNVKQQRTETEHSDNPPKPFGYQGAGEVISVGEGITSFVPGDRVCCFGDESVHSRWVVVPQNLCAKIPDNTSYEDASGMNLVLTAMQAMRRAKPEFGEKMLVVGAGVVGQVVCQLGHAAGLDVMAWDLSSMRLEVAARKGVSVCNVRDNDAVKAGMEFTEEKGFDIAVIVIGGNGTEVLRQVSDVMRRYPDGHKVGRIILPGGLETLCKWGAQGLDNLDLRCSARTGPGYKDKQWELGKVEYPESLVRWTTTTNLQLAIQWLNQGILDINMLITHRFMLKEVCQAVDLLAENPEKAIAVVLKM